MNKNLHDAFQSGEYKLSCEFRAEEALARTIQGIPEVKKDYYLDNFAYNCNRVLFLLHLDCNDDLSDYCGFTSHLIDDFWEENYTDLAHEYVGTKLTYLYPFKKDAFDKLKEMLTESGYECIDVEKKKYFSGRTQVGFYIRI